MNKSLVKPDGLGGAVRLLPETEGIRLIRQHAVPYPEGGFADGPDEAVAVAERLGFPVVLKVVCRDVVHKTDVGGVVLDLVSGAEVRSAAADMIEGLRKKVPDAIVSGLLVCRQSPPGLEMMVGALRDQVCGPAVMCGLGGVSAELYGDVSFRLAPVAQEEAFAMLEELKSWPLLRGFRGNSAADVESLATVIATISRIICDFPEIVELDLNPVIVYSEGVMAVDARVVVGGGPIDAVVDTCSSDQSWDGEAGVE